MKACQIPGLMFLLASVAFAQNYQIGWCIIVSIGLYAHNKKGVQSRL